MGIRSGARPGSRPHLSVGSCCPAWGAGVNGASLRISWQAPSSVFKDEQQKRPARGPWVMTPMSCSLGLCSQASGCAGAGRTGPEALAGLGLGQALGLSSSRGLHLAGLAAGDLGDSGVSSTRAAEPRGGLCPPESAARVPSCVQGCGSSAGMRDAVRAWCHVRWRE